MFINLTNVPVALASPGTVTIAASVGTAAAVVTKSTHGLLAGTPLSFTAGTSVPTGMVSGETYYVKAGATLLTNSFALVDVLGNNVITTDTGVGTITCAATDVVAEINVENAEVLAVEIKNTGSNPLDLFDVYGRTTPSGNDVKVSTNATDYSNAVYPVLKAIGAPVTLAAAATALVFVDVKGLTKVTLKASSSTGATKLDIHAANKFTV